MKKTFIKKVGIALLCSAVMLTNVVPVGAKTNGKTADKATVSADAKPSKRPEGAKDRKHSKPDNVSSDAKKAKKPAFDTTKKPAFDKAKNVASKDAKKHVSKDDAKKATKNVASKDAVKDVVSKDAKKKATASKDAKKQVVSKDAGKQVASKDAKKPDKNIVSKDANPITSANAKKNTNQGKKGNNSVIEFFKSLFSKIFKSFK
jgi:hypothetical protein